MNALVKTSLIGLLLFLALDQVCVGQTERVEEAKTTTAESEAEKNELRTWKDSSGKFEVLARFVRQDGETILLDRKDGKQVRVPLKRLSEQDQEYIRELLADRPHPDGEKESPFLDVEADTLRSAESLVVVAVDRGDKQELKLGYVFRKSDDLAYVAVPNQSQNPVDYSDGDLAFMVLVQTPERRSVKAKRVAEFYYKQTLILSAPAAEIPPPINFNIGMALKVGDEISVVTYEIDQANAAFGRFSKTAKVKKVVEDAQGGISKFEIEADNGLSLNGGLAIGKHGNVMGVMQTRFERGNKIVIDVAPYELLRKIEEPEFAIRFAPKSGDQEKINYEIVVAIVDPFEKAKDVSLLVKQLKPEDYRKKDNAVPTAEPIADAEKLELTVREPDEIVQKQIVSKMLGKVFVADFTTDNPGIVVSYERSARDPYCMLQVQVAFKTPDGKQLHLLPINIAYDPEMLISRARMRESLPPNFDFRIPDAPASSVKPNSKEKANSIIPDIPGLNGIPFDMLQVQEVDGGWKLTSKMTAFTEKIAHEPQDFPAPERTGVTAVSTVQKLEGVDAIQLKMQVSQAPVRTPVIFSGDGDYFYVVDSENVLRKIRSASLLEEAKLEIGADCEHLAYSKAGVVLALRKNGVVWVVDEKTLRVKLEIPVPAVQLVAANPTTTIAFAQGAPYLGKERLRQDRKRPEDLAKKEEESKKKNGEVREEVTEIVESLDTFEAFESMQSPATALFMLDLAEGQLIHQIHSGYGEGGKSVLTADKMPFLAKYNSLIQMSSDGKYCFTVGGEDIETAVRRFRVDQRDLIFEVMSKPLTNRSYSLFSADGKWIACWQSGFVNALYETRDLKYPVHELPRFMGSVAGFDSATGEMYLHTSRELEIVSDQGVSRAKIRSRWELRKHEFEPTGIVVHPQGGRFVVWGNQVAYFDLDQKRTSSQVKTD